MLESISFAGSIASLAGLLVTVYVARSIKRISESYTRQGLIPTFLLRLRASLRNLNHAIESRDAQSLKTELRKCKAVLQRVSEHAPSVETAGIVEEIDDLLLRRGLILFSSARDLRGKISGEVERLSLLKSELQWSQRDD